MTLIDPSSEMDSCICAHHMCSYIKMCGVPVVNEELNCRMGGGKHFVSVRCSLFQSWQYC